MDVLAGHGDLLDVLVAAVGQPRQHGLLGARTEQIPFVDGRLGLGQWQRILLFGFNGDPRADYTLTLVG